jgi:hypothetical protein
MNVYDRAKCGPQLWRSLVQGSQRMKRPFIRHRHDAFIDGDGLVSCNVP